MLRITCDPVKRQRTLDERGLDMHRADEIFKGLHATRLDDRIAYGEPRFVTVGWLDSKAVVVVWTPRGSETRIISMRQCREREAKRLWSHLTGS
jgi:uncharacterized DUF497 family protein